MHSPAGDPEAPPAWDPLVRLTHWGVALAVVLNGLLVEGGSIVHIWIGYAALALLALRLLWGVIGPAEARFSAFPPSLRAAVGHVADILAGRSRAHASHNPLSALMAYALWGMLAAVVATGLVLEGEPFPSNRLPDRAYGIEADEGEGSGMIEELHEMTANLLLALAALHVAGVALESRLSGRNLVRRMLVGTRAPGEGG